MLALGALVLLSVNALADYKADVGYTKLQAELGASIPTGSGVVVSQIEVGPGAYAPDTTEVSLAGKTFNLISGASTPFWHASAVATHYYGLYGSMAPGVGTINLYEANDWLGLGFLYFDETSSAPNTETAAVENHSWIGTYDNGGPYDVDVLRRFDFAIQQSGFLGVVGLNNGNAGNLPALLASSYNGISVGLSNGSHSYGTNTVDGSGRTKPEIVAPADATSWGTPMVSSAAAMLRQVTPTNAATSVTMKALLMAGATKDQFATWSRTTMRPIDTVYGAGQLNVYNSYHLLIAGQQAASADVACARVGWDYRTTTTASGGWSYFFDIPANGPYSLSAALVWNRAINATILDGEWTILSSTLANLTLKLYAASGFAKGALLDTSASPVDNVEHIYQTALAPGRYALEVTADTASVSYGLAWYSVPTLTVEATAPTTAETGPVAGTFTVTRTGSTAAALTLNYTIAGTATNGTDYAAIPSSVTIPVGATSATVTITPTPDSLAEGDETVVLKIAPDPSFTSGTAGTATVTIQDKPEDAWRFSNFTAAELADPELSGDLADFEKDGIVNLLEYAFGLDPKTPDTGGLPVVTRPSGVLTIAYTRVKNATDLSYVVEVSNDLTTWHSGPAYTAVTGTVDHGATETVTVGSLLAPDPAGRQFIQVRITRP